MNQSDIYLPLCDLLFNLISLLSYFSDIVFDVLAVYTLYVDARYGWFAFTLGCIVASTFACQVMSMRWHLRERRLADHHQQQHRLPKTGRGSGVASTVLLVHVLQCGVLWRYFRLFMPVDLRRVKRAVRDLCILRLIHFGGAAGPMLLVHFYQGWTSTMAARSPSDLTRLHVVSTSLCMFSACWALASFSKHIRQQNLHRLVLTWLGVIYQFLWRLGTVSSRVAALTLYATVYNFWVLLVIALHWFSMCLWLASNFPFRGEKLSRTRKCALSLLVTYVYVFCYLHVDLQETSNARAKMITFYVTVFFENTLLLALWWHGHNSDQTPAWHLSAGVFLVVGGFLFGVVFMLLYYRYFHVTRLKHGLMPVDYGSWPSMTQATSGHLQSCALCRLGTLEHYDQCSPAGAHCGGEYSAVAPSNHPHNHNSVKGTTAITHPQFNHQHRHSHHHHHHHHHAQNMMEHAQQKSAGGGGGGGGGVAYIQLPGVFNCRLNPAFKRKKKKPTTFIPVPFQALATVQTNGKAVIPFWKKQPVQQVFTAEAVTVDPVQQQQQELLKKASSPETSMDTMQKNVGGCGASRVDIQQKLMEKRQKQLQELRVIEEEIKQGKFQRPHPSDLSEQGTLRQPIPRLKKQPVQEESSAAVVAVLVDQIQIQQQTPSSRKTNEILLTPHCLDTNNGSGSSGGGGGTMVYYDYWEEKWRFAPPTLRQQCPSVGGGGQHQWRQSNGCGGPSDLDSQASLPRSFTLPREFRYNRKSKARRVVRSEHFVTSTNSSDGDVDSGDENDSGGDANRRNNLSSPTADHACLDHRYRHQQQQQQHLSSAFEQQEAMTSALVTAPAQQQQMQIRIATPSNLFHHHHLHHPLQGRSAYNRHETQL